MENLEHIHSRAIIYSDLSILFHRPGKKILSLLSVDSIADRRPAYSSLNLNLDPLARSIQDDTDARSAEGLLLAMNREYTRLFVTAFPGVPVPPYGSTHMEDPTVIWGKTTRDVVKIYSRAGLRISEDFRDIPDHFAVELEFMFYLNRCLLFLADPQRFDRKAECPSDLSTENLFEIEREFLTKHLLKWGPGFLEQVSKESRLPFYRELASLTAALLENESIRINDGSQHEEIV